MMKVFYGWNNSRPKRDDVLLIIIVLFLDRYVIIGCHRDAWVFGAVDPSSGNSVLVEAARLLGKLVKKGQPP